MEGTDTIEELRRKFYAVDSMIILYTTSCWRRRHINIHAYTLQRARPDDDIEWLGTVPVLSKITRIQNRFTGTGTHTRTTQ